MKRLGSKFISILLTLTLFFTGVLPQAAFAAAEAETQGKVGNGAQADFTPHKEVKKLFELEELRDQHTKHYLNNDGSRTAEVSFNSVHYKDTQGKWKDISNKLIPSEKQGFALRNEANAFKAYFADNTGSPYLVSLNNQAYSLSWNILDANPVKLEKSEDSVLYREIFSGIDLEYQQLADGVKENIILKTSGTSNHFTFRIKTGGLTPVLHEDNSVGFYTASNGDEPGELKYSIPRPYMVDSNHEVSQYVTFQLRSTGKEDEYELSVIADYDWLSDPARAWLVTIDPIVTAYTTSNVITDTYIVENQPYQYYNSTYMTVGYDSVLGGRAHALVKFNSPSIPAGAIVTDAY